MVRASLNLSARVDKNPIYFYSTIAMQLSWLPYYSATAYPDLNLNPNSNSNCIPNIRHQICDFSRDIILYDFEHSNIGTIFDSTTCSWCYVIIRIDTWLSILYLIMGYSTFTFYNSSQPCKKVVIELKFIIIWNLSRDLLQGIHKIWTWLNAIFYFF